MLELSTGWQVELDRGPDWLFVRLHEPECSDDDGIGLADAIWDLLQQNLAHRLCLELDDVDILRSYVVGQLVVLHRRVKSRGGVMRLCGLSDSCQAVLRTSRLDDRFPHYHNRGEAVRGYIPHRPR